MRPQVEAEKSVLVDVMHRPERLFPENSDSRVRTTRRLEKSNSSDIV